MKKNIKTSAGEVNTLSGMFELPSGHKLVGELASVRARARLKVHGTGHFEPHFGEPLNVRGTLFDGKCVDLFECFPQNVNSTIRSGETHFTSTYAPSYIVFGESHLDRERENIVKVAFRNRDLTQLFYDFGAFGSFTSPSRALMSRVLAEAGSGQSAIVGDNPWIGYFVGNTNVSSVEMPFGRILVGHRPRIASGGPSGTSISGNMYAEIEFHVPQRFDSVYDYVTDLLCLLSVMAGRRQTIKRFFVLLGRTSGEEKGSFSTVFPVLTPRRAKFDGHKPHPADVPLNPILRPTEFESVVQNWLARQDSWRAARWRYVTCLSKNNKYGIDRIVAAANMFDILPSEAGLPRAELALELQKVKSDFETRLRSIPEGIDRNSLLSSLGRLGKPSLPKKVAYRAQMVEDRMGGMFEGLTWICGIAIKVRNHFVHGASHDFNFRAVEGYVPFLTDALEFVFGASDLIEAGWEPSDWTSGGLGHNFARFKSDYRYAIADIRKAVQVRGPT